MMETRLLSIDFDYFVPLPTGSDPLWLMFDWGHREDALHHGLIWSLRAADLLRNGIPLPATSGEETRFWPHIRLAEDAVVYVADSHAAAAVEAVRDGITEVWSFDAHHDAGYDGHGQAMHERGEYDCANWILAYPERPRRRGARVFYPAWKTDAFAVEPVPDGDERVHRCHADRMTMRHLPVFDRVFICRSGGWVPPWLDTAFIDFLLAAPRPGGMEQVVIDGDAGIAPRPWDAAAVRAEALATTEAFAALRGPVDTAVIDRMRAASTYVQRIEEQQRKGAPTCQP